MNASRLTIYAGAFVVFSAACAAAAPAYVAGNLNLRSGPGTNNEIVAKIPGGSLVDASNCSNGWCEVAWQGKNGFAIQTALDMSGRVPARPAPGRARAPVVDEDIVVEPPVYYEAPPYYYRPYGYYGYGPYWGPYRGWRRRW